MAAAVVAAAAADAVAAAAVPTSPLTLSTATYTASQTFSNVLHLV